MIINCPRQLRTQLLQYSRTATKNQEDVVVEVIVINYTFSSSPTPAVILIRWRSSRLDLKPVTRSRPNRRWRFLRRHSKSMDDAHCPIPASYAEALLSSPRMCSMFAKRLALKRNNDREEERAVTIPSLQSPFPLGVRFETRPTQKTDSESRKSEALGQRNLEHRDDSLDAEDLPEPVLVDRALLLHVSGQFFSNRLLQRARAR
ncbi:hypothetical protein ZHAS_00013773 [Anopheles sinensis]|uniref:Uncharacterized protein n=1 Tax=Anopheles sinensis TaxID=74873 RepID=A0A084W6F2_ANOSI|nr:hypothetical protein ZHAS_00013773 [Anopheles sinensis]